MHHCRDSKERVLPSTADSWGIPVAEVQRAPGLKISTSENNLESKIQ